MSLFDGLGDGLSFDARTTSPDNLYSGGYDGMGDILAKKFGLQFVRPGAAAGEVVTRESAMTYSAIWACVSLMSKHIAMLPWHAMEKQGDRRVVAEDSPADAMLYRVANEEMSSYEFRMAMLTEGLPGGNSLAEVERNRFGEAVAMWHIDWSRVNPDRDRRGRLIYEISENNGPNTVLKPSDVLHWRFGPTMDGVVAMGVLDYARQCISSGLAMEKFGGAFFGNGAMPSGVIEFQSSGDKFIVPDDWDATAARNLKRSWNKNHKGAGNSGGVEILEPGQTFKPIAISNENAQFLESRQFGVIEICRWFNMKPHKVAALERSTNNNIEAENISYVTDTILPVTVRCEQEVDFKLFGRDTRKYNRMNLAALLRGDMKTRQEFYKTMMDRGVYSIDDVLAMEDKNPLEGGLGDLRMVQMNMVSVEQAKKNGNTGQKQNGASE